MYTQTTTSYLSTTIVTSYDFNEPFHGEGHKVLFVYLRLWPWPKTKYSDLSKWPSKCPVHLLTKRLGWAFLV